MADISYTRTTWADGAEGGTAIDATKLNNIEQGIVDAVAAIGPNDTTEDGTLKAQIDALGDSVHQPVLRSFSGSYTIAANDSENLRYQVSNIPDGYSIVSYRMIAFETSKHVALTGFDANASGEVIIKARNLQSTARTGSVAGEVLCMKL